MNFFSFLIILAIIFGALVVLGGVGLFRFSSGTRDRTFSFLSSDNGQKLVRTAMVL